MSAFKGTPGPWAVNPVSAQVDAMPSLLPVCQLLWPTDQRSEAETEANARLISAAPELLEALRRVLSSQTIKNPDPDSDPDVIFARAAIAKATGGQP